LPDNAKNTLFSPRAHQTHSDTSQMWLKIWPDVLKQQEQLDVAAGGSHLDIPYEAYKTPIYGP
jgi:hypothetical protein